MSYLQFTKNLSTKKKMLFKSGHIEFFLRHIVFEIWAIMYTVDFDVYELMYAKDVRDFCDSDSDANQ